MARNEQRGRRERVARQREPIQPTGPATDAEEQRPSDEELAELRVPKDVIRSIRREEPE